MKTIEIPIKKIRDNSIQFDGGAKLIFFICAKPGYRGGRIMMHKTAK